VTPVATSVPKTLSAAAKVVGDVTEVPNPFVILLLFGFGPENFGCLPVFFRVFPSVLDAQFWCKYGDLGTWVKVWQTRKTGPEGPVFALDLERF
jgi:hypothetical protein